MAGLAKPKIRATIEPQVERIVTIELPENLAHQLLCVMSAMDGSDYRGLYLKSKNHLRQSGREIDSSGHELRAGISRALSEVFPDAE